MLRGRVRQEGTAGNGEVWADKKQQEEKMVK